MSAWLADSTYGPFPWHLLLFLLAGLQSLFRRLSRDHHLHTSTLWDSGSWCVIFITGFTPFWADNFWLVWWQYVILSPILFFLGFWLSEKVYHVCYNEGAIAHMVALYIYLVMTVMSLVIKVVFTVFAYFS